MTPTKKPSNLHPEPRPRRLHVVHRVSVVSRVQIDERMNPALSQHVEDRVLVSVVSVLAALCTM
jgi:hypothetical protein